MSEEKLEAASGEERSSIQAETTGKGALLPGVFAVKQGMSTVYSESGVAVPVTVLKVTPWVVTQVKTKEKDGYSAVQIACLKPSQKNSTKAELGIMKRAGVEKGYSQAREFRVNDSSQFELGSAVSVESLKKGDIVKASGRSKGKGFQGVIKRHGFGGGPAAHGSGFHRRPGSIGNRTLPGRTMPGKKLPGHAGDKNITVRNLTIVDVLQDQGVLLVKGSVPGARNSWIRLVKVDGSEQT